MSADDVRTAKVGVRVIDKDAMILRQSVGTATDQDGNEIEITQNMDGSPLIRMPDGRYFSYGWEALIRAAAELISAE